MSPNTKGKIWHITGLLLCCVLSSVFISAIFVGIIGMSNPMILYVMAGIFVGIFYPNYDPSKYGVTTNSEPSGGFVNPTFNQSGNNPFPTTPSPSTPPPSRVAPKPKENPLPKEDPAQIIDRFKLMDME